MFKRKGVKASSSLPSDATTPIVDEVIHADGSPKKEKKSSKKPGVKMSEDHNLLGVVRGLRVPLTVWLVGYSTLSMLPKAVRNPNLLTSYIPGMSITALARGELALEPLFVLSGVTAGLILEANTPADAHIPTTWSIARFWFRKLTSIVPAVLSCFGAVLVSRWTGSSVVKYSRFAHLFGTIMDAQFYLLAPWAFQYLHKSHRGAAPRLVIASSLASGTLAAITSLAFGLKVPKADGIPWAHAVTGIASTAAQVPFRFPAFMAGLALAVERHRKGSGPSNVNQIIGVGVSAALWVALLMTPPELGSEALEAVVAAFRYPMCTLATYLALRPIIAFPPELANTIPWRRKLHNILSHPITEAVTLVTLTAEMIHREVAANILRLLGMTGLFDEVTVSDGSLMALWGCVVGVSGVLGYAIYKVVQAPSLGFVRKAVEKKWKKGV